MNQPRAYRDIEGSALGWIVVTVSLVVATAACARPSLVVSPSRPETSALPLERLTETAILVSIDGLRPDAIAAFKPPTLQRLIDEGSYTLAARTILPSKTLPSHTSMLTGEPPDRHGVLWNSAMENSSEPIEIPTIFGIARARGYSTAAFFSKSKFTHLQRPGTLDYSQAPGGWFGRWSASRTIQDVEDHLAASTPNLLFVHLSDPDAEGHASGWMSPRYGRGVLRADAAVGRLMKAADRAYGVGRYTLIVTADHGGQGRDHGSDHALDVTIPWIAWGQGVVPGQIADGVRTMDTASTILFVLGVDAPPGWIGSPVRDAFTAAAAQD